MSRTVDQRIVEMRFDNAQFEKGVKESTTLLDKLKDALSFGKGQSEIEKAASGFSLDGIAQGVDNISDKFSALGAIGFSVLQDLTKRAMDFGGQLIRSAIDPIVGGGRSRALNMEQANFQFEGLGMDVEATMENALEAVKGTAYGLDEAAVLAANFGATGMEAGQEMADALRGVSGVAAMAGASYSDVGNIFGKVAGQGRLMGDDLNRLAARGVNAAATMADQMGITEAEFRDMVSQGEITFDMFAKGMNEAFGDHATKANETYTGSLSNMRAAFARLGAMFFGDHLTRQRDLFNAITPLVDRLAGAFEPLIGRFSEFLNLRYENFIGFLDMLDDDSTGGRVFEAIAEAVGNLASTIMTYAGPIAAAFGDIFGGTTLTDVLNFIGAIDQFIIGFALTETQAANLQRTFAGVFAVFDIGFYIFGEFLQMIGRLVSRLFEGTDGFLGFTGGIGDSIVAFRDLVKEGGAVEAIFGAIEAAIGGVIDFIGKAIGVVGDFFSGIDLSIFDGFSGTVADSLGPVATLGGLAVAAWRGFLDLLGWIWEALKPVGSAVADWAGDFVGLISDAMRTTDWSLVLDAINTGLLAGFFLIFKDLFSNFGDALTGGGIIDSITGVFGSFTDSLKAMQNDLKANTLLKIAGAIALLTASAIALSMVDSAALAKSLGAMAIMFGQLMGAMAIFEKIAMGPGILKLPILAAGLVILAGALALLTIPVVILSKLDWEDLAKGMAGLAAMMLLLIPAAWALSSMSGSFIRIGLGMIPLAFGLGLLADVVADLSELSWHELAKGLSGLAGSLLVISGALAIMPGKSIIGKSIGLIILATAIGMLVEPLKELSGMTWHEIAKGLTVLAGSLGILVLGLSLMRGTVSGSLALIAAAGALTILMDPLERMSKLGWSEIGKIMTTLGGSLAILAAGLFAMGFGVAGSAALLVASVALSALIGPLERMGKLGWSEIGKIMTTLGGSLAILAAGLFAMSFGVAGALALIPTAIGLNMLVPVLYALAGLTWTELLKGLAGLAGVMLVLGIAGLVMAPVTPILLLLGAAIALIGAGAMGLGAGLLLFAAGVAALGAAFAMHGAVIIEMIESIIDLIPRLLVAIIDGLVDAVVALANGASEIAIAISALVLTILLELQKLIPEGVKTVGMFLEAMFKEIERLAPQFGLAAGALIDAFVDTMGDEERVSNIVSMVELWIQAILDFLEDNAYQWGEQGAKIVVEFAKGIWSGLGLPDLGLGIAGMGDAVLDGIDKFLDPVKNAGEKVAEFFGFGVESKEKDSRASGSVIGNAAKDGVDDTQGANKTAGEGIGSAAVDGFESQEGAANKAGQGVGESASSGVETGIRNGKGGISSEAESVGGAISSGMERGISTSRVVNKAISVAQSAISAAKARLDSNSPSRVFIGIGQDISDGWAIGIDDHADRVSNASSAVADDSIRNVRHALSRLPSHLDTFVDTEPAIRPVLDLSNIESGASRMNQLLNQGIVSPYARASGVVSSRRNQAEVEAQNADSLRKVEVNQYNTSPKALDQTEIYRKTRNLISLTEKELTNA